MEPVLVVLIIFGSVGLIVWKFIESRNRERMAMIEKGTNPADFKGLPLREMFKPNPLSNLKWGLLALFVGAGILCATWLEHVFYFHGDSIYPASMLIFGGVALVLFYFIASRKMKSE